MRRLGDTIWDGSDPILNLQKLLELLACKREEAFEGERAIRFFQFRALLLFPDEEEAKYVKWAGLIAAVKMLETIDDDHFIAEEDARQRERGERTLVMLSDKPSATMARIDTLRRDRIAYGKLYDEFIAKHGGLMSLLDASRPSEFDQVTNSRIERIHIVADLIDYRLRYIQHSGDLQPSTGANHSHALFFCWWPTHEIPGTRGRTAPGKSVAPKTMGTWWGKFERTALFIYLIQKHGFQQLPMDTDTELFVDGLLRDANDTAEVLRFLGAYAYLVETFRAAGGDLFYLPIPESVPRVAISTAPFSRTELETISQYDAHYHKMSE